MAGQSEAMVEALKRALRSNGLTYRDVGKGLGLSEASVKRLFAQRSFSLARYDQICQLMGLEITDLARLADESRSLHELTEAQERELVSNVPLLLVAFLVSNGWTFREILQRYRFTEPQLIQHFAKLDKLRLIELLPGNRFKLLISPNFAWRRSGPIQQFFVERMQDDYFETDFAQENELFLLVSGMLSKSSGETAARKLREFAQSFNDLRRADMPLPLDKRHAYSIVFALRRWRPAVFAEFRKDDDEDAA